jgi:extracellular factor (EF) 3-hydroxypalmitic acid methyl ester biosynthesis protein
MPTQTTDSLLTYLEGLFQKGGPDPEDYDAFTRWLADTAGEIKKGTLSALEVHRFWFDLGEEYLKDASVGNILGKRHGYAGDFEVIDKLYRQHLPASHDKWDRYLHAQGASVAVRNRKQYFIDLAVACTFQHRRSNCRVLNLGSGPARDICQYFESFPKGDLHFDCVDMDDNAITYASEVCRDHLTHITFHKANVLRFHPQQQYHLIWSAGLFDYLTDRLFVLTLRRYYKAVLPGGEMVVGNFSPTNPTHNCMFVMGNWTLLYRDAGHLRTLAREAGIDDSLVSVASEPLGINLFLHLQKPLK